MASLLDQAKKMGSKYPSYKEATDQEIELALAWVKGEVGLNQVMKVLDRSSNGAYSILALALKTHLRK